MTDNQNQTIVSIPVMGVDPGTEGGISVLTAIGEVAYVEPIHAKMTTKFLISMIATATTILKSLSSDFVSGVCFLEKVGVMPRDGKRSAFTFGRIYGLLEGSILSHAVDVKPATPLFWMSKMNCLTQGNKNITKRKAQELFPEVKVTHNIADALLIAEHGRREMAL